jgi:hypothetical protein
LTDDRLASRLVARARKRVLREFDADSCALRLLAKIERLSDRK